jgi:hypothetical protein
MAAYHFGFSTRTALLNVQDTDLHVILATAIDGSYLLHKLELFCSSRILEAFTAFSTHVFFLYSPYLLSLALALFDHVAYQHHPSITRHFSLHSTSASPPALSSLSSLHQS